MRPPLLFAVISCLFILSCSEGSFARYRIKTGSLELIPSLDPPADYRSTADTIALYELIQGGYYVETNLPSPIPSTEVDKVEVQRFDYYAASTPEVYLIEYHLQSIPEAGQRTGSADLINISLVTGNNVSIATLSLAYEDSLICNSPDCRYADTLSLDSVDYYEVYYLAEDPQEPNIYINRSEGVVAFRDQQLKTYQRIK